MIGKDLYSVMMKRQNKKQIFQIKPGRSIRSTSHFHEYMTGLGFQRCSFDFCLCYKITKFGTIYVLVFVDDLLICCKNLKCIHFLKEKLSQRFNIKDLGKVKNYIGIKIEYNEGSDLKLNQKAYIESLAEKFQITESKLYDTPMEINLKLEKN